MRWYAAKFRRARHCRPMVSGGMCRHAASRRRVIERKDRVRCATRFECANFLKIFAFKEEGSAALLIQARTSQDRCAVNVRSNPLVSRKDCWEVECNIYVDHPKKASITPNMSINPRGNLKVIFARWISYRD
jgi:hypothetical protein